jgi:hypothetical protein
MALPTSRNTTYTPDSPVKSYDLNDLQDKQIDSWNGKHGDRVLLLPLASAYESGTWVKASTQWVADANPSGLTWMVPLHDGDRLREVRCMCESNVAGDTVISVTYSRVSTGVEAASIAFVPPLFVENTLLSWHELILDCNDVPVIGAVPPGGETEPITLLIVGFSTETVANKIGAMKIVYDHP